MNKRKKKKKQGKYERESKCIFIKFLKHYYILLPEQ